MLSGMTGKEGTRSWRFRSWFGAGRGGASGSGCVGGNGKAGSKSCWRSERVSVYGGVRGFLRGGGEKRGRLGMLDTSSTRHGHTRFTFRRSSGSSQVTYEIGEANGSEEERTWRK